MADAKAIELKRVEWSDQVRDHLNMVKHWPDHVTCKWFQDEIEAERILALGVFQDGRHVGTAIYDFENGDQGSELVIKAAGGHLQGGDLVATVLPAFERLAMQADCVSVGFQTRRQGLVKKTVLMGYEFGEVTMRKKIR